ncbi:serine/threonine-protein kinase TNNI3K-like [Eleutherodactylus coqui]|uniref:serine/threonine-protein kinase TNNI3K-like n=1 Tax=Eleutherodactylus coqui TaxID=57060 RepID=UPI0034623CDC
MEGTCLAIDPGQARCIDGSTLLHVAAYYGEEECTEMLLNYGADVNWKDDDGNTTLHMVCYGEPGQPTRMDCLQLLLTHKVSTRKSNKKGLLPIHCAAIQGRKDVLQALIESEPKMREFINEHMSKRDTPSLPYLALANGHLENAKWLISNNFNFTAGEDEELLFDIVCSKNREESKVRIVNFLISHGLNVNICDKNGNRQRVPQSYCSYSKEPPSVLVIKPSFL